MPNWCTNTLNINNLTSEQVKRLVAAAEGERLLAEILPEPNYEETPVAKTFPSIGAQFAKTEEERAVALANEPTISSNNWYDWRLQNWGTKWEASEIIINEEANSVSISFMSAWSPPNQVWIQALINEMPNAEVVLTYKETAMDFAGVTRADRERFSDETLHPSNLYDAWLKRTQSEETQAILKDEDHDDYEDVWEQVHEDWYEVEADLIDAALDRL